MPATRFHKVKIESQRWKSSIKVYSIPRFIFQWQLASDMIKDVFTLEQKVKWFAGSHYYLMRISHATVFWRSLSIMPRGIIFPSNSICVMTYSPKFWIKMIIPLLKIMGPLLDSLFFKKLSWKSQIIFLFDCLIDFFLKKMPKDKFINILLWMFQHFDKYTSITC